LAVKATGVGWGRAVGSGLGGFGVVVGSGVATGVGVATGGSGLGAAEGSAGLAVGSGECGGATTAGLHAAKAIAATTRVARRYLDIEDSECSGGHFAAVPTRR
jgi:hypothetical protein